MKLSNLSLALACLMVGACTVQAKAEHNTPPAIDVVVVDQHATSFADAATITLQNDGTLLSEVTTLSAVGCCDQGYEIHSATEAGCCDQGYQVSSMDGTTKTLLAVAFSAFLALLALQHQRITRTFQFLR